MTQRLRRGPVHRHRFVLQARAATARPDRIFVEWFVCPACYAVKRRTHRILRTRLADETIVAPGPAVKISSEEVVLP